MGIDFIQLSIGSESICLHSPNQQSVANIQGKPSNSLINQALRNPSYSWSYVGSTSNVTKRKSHMLRKPNFTAGSGVTILSRSRGMDLYYLSFGFDIYLRDAVAATRNVSESKNICNVQLRAMVALELFFHLILSWRYYYHAYIAHRIMVIGV